MKLSLSSINKAILLYKLKADSIKLLPGGTSKAAYVFHCGKERYVLKTFPKKEKKCVNYLIKTCHKINKKKDYCYKPS